MKKMRTLIKEKKRKIEATSKETKTTKKLLFFCVFLGNHFGKLSVLLVTFNHLILTLIQHAIPRSCTAKQQQNVSKKYEINTNKQHNCTSALYSAQFVAARSSSVHRSKAHQALSGLRRPIWLTTTFTQDALGT